MDNPERKNKYARVIKGVTIDFYDIARAFGITDPAIAHALKKLLRYGCGEKSLAKDVDEAIFSLERWKQGLAGSKPDLVIKQSEKDWSGLGGARQCRHVCEELRCRRPAGHGGSHAVLGMEWEDSDGAYLTATSPINE